MHNRIHQITKSLNINAWFASDMSYQTQVRVVVAAFVTLAIIVAGSLTLVVASGSTAAPKPKPRATTTTTAKPAATPVTPDPPDEAVQRADAINTYCSGLMVQIMAQGYGVSPSAQEQLNASAKETMFSCVAQEAQSYDGPGSIISEPGQMAWPSADEPPGYGE